MHYIDDTDVYAVEAVPIAPSGGRHTVIWGIRLSDSTNEEYLKMKVEFTEYVHPQLTKEQQVLYAVRSVVFKKPNNTREGIDYGWGSTNKGELFTVDEITDDQLDHEILKKAFRFYRKYPQKGLHQDDLVLSLNVTPENIYARANALALQRRLPPAVNSIHDYDPGIFEKLAQYVEKTEAYFIGGGYFQEVQLTHIHDRPYAFVLMPFREEELPQSIYFDTIKPVVETHADINCLRADDKQNANRISDQIYTQIKRAKLLIAEVTSRNPNVMVEIGVALTLGKQVYMFYNEVIRKREDIPFYIKQVPVWGYSSADDLSDKLKKIEVP